jgi:NAD(P)H-hydrate epimerase
MIPFREVAVLDRNAQSLGVSVSQLMENAGKESARIMRENISLKKKRILVLCGLGNNGGDGFVLARYLRDQNIEVFLLGQEKDIKTDTARENYKKLVNIVKMTNRVDKLHEKIKESDIIVDAMLGVGITGKLKEPYLTCVNAINSAKGKTIVAIDIPTGFGSLYAIKPDITITFHDVKEGMNKRNCGKIVVADIGIPKEAEHYTGPGDIVYYPLPRPDSHKGMNGRVLVVGGGPYTGAPALVGFGAYRVGVDLVRIATPVKSYLAVAAHSPNFIVESLGRDILTLNDVSAVEKLLDVSDTLVIGNGLGTNIETKRATIKIIKKCKKPIVIDADTIEVVGENISVLKGHSGVITPHAREFKKLTGIKLSEDLEKRCEAVKNAAKKIGFTVLLKGRIDIISDGKYTKLNRTGNAGMSVGGTGDVLAGVVGGLLSKGVPPFNAARIGAFLNGYAGDLAFEEKGYSLLATDVAEKISIALRKFLLSK